MDRSSCHEANYDQEVLRRQVNVLIKEIGQIKKNKGDASELLAQKVEADKKVAEGTSKVAELQKKRDLKAMQLGNIVDKNSAISMTEVSSDLYVSRHKADST
jgi:seryl-tRNA synthetase